LFPLRSEAVTGGADEGGEGVGRAQGVLLILRESDAKAVTRLHPLLEMFTAYRSRANMARIRQSRPDSGLGFLKKPLNPFIIYVYILYATHFNVGLVVRDYHK